MLMHTIRSFQLQTDKQLSNVFNTSLKDLSVHCQTYNTKCDCPRGIKKHPWLYLRFHK